MRLLLAQTVLDCPDPFALATFYSALTGLELPPGATAGVTGVSLENGDQPSIRFQIVDEYIAPTWPTGPAPQQSHLDFWVDDLDAGEIHALSVGARLADFQPGTSFRVFLDPVDHPFCLFHPGD